MKRIGIELGDVSVTGALFEDRAPRAVDRLWEALMNEWTRLLVGADRRLAPRVDFYTWHLVMALAWMDEPGLLKRIDRLAQSPEAPLEVRRHAAATKESVFRARRPFGP